MLEELSQKKKVTGIKQSKKAVAEGSAEKMFLAYDILPELEEEILTLCKEKAVPVERVSTMKKLGQICGISVGAAAAVLLKD